MKILGNKVSIKKQNILKAFILWQDEGHGNRQAQYNRGKDVVGLHSPAFEEWFNAEKLFLLNHIKRKLKALEVGCGNGRSLLDIAAITADLTGIDYDEMAIQKAKKTLANHPSAKHHSFFGKSLFCICVRQ